MGTEGSRISRRLSNVPESLIQTYLRRHLLTYLLTRVTRRVSSSTRVPTTNDLILKEKVHGTGRKGMRETGPEREGCQRGFPGF